MASMDAMTQELAGLKTEVADLKTKLGQLGIHGAANLDSLKGASSSSHDSSSAALAEPAPKIEGVKAAVIFLAALTLCAGLLDLLHWILLFIYDTNLLALRIITVVIPVLMGIVLYRNIRIHWLLNVVGMLALGAVSVLGMLGITSHIDGVSLLPENIREWREAAEYVFAIACSLMTGLLIENWREAHQISLRKSINLGLLIQRDDQGKFKASEWTEQVESLFRAAAPFISAGTAIVSAVRVFMG
jgi:cytochrome c biogenesis protein CcdA